MAEKRHPPNPRVDGFYWVWDGHQWTPALWETRANLWFMIGGGKRYWVDRIGEPLTPPVPVNSLQ